MGARLPDSEVSYVTKRQMTLFEAPQTFVTENGRDLGTIQVCYETMGTLNGSRSNAILLCHALTADSHVGGKYGPGDTSVGWWDPMVGPGRVFDTNRYFIISSNVLGGCGGTTGPSSIDPQAGRRYGMRFPIVTVRDMVRVQRELVTELGIRRLLAVSGGSFGAFQTVEWAVMYPDDVCGIIPIAGCDACDPVTIAHDEAMRQAIMNDTQWAGGDYYGTIKELTGLGIARMIAKPTYRALGIMWEQFGRAVRGNDPDAPWKTWDGIFEVESYMRHQGETVRRRFDPNSYIYILRAQDLHDVGKGRGGAVAAYRALKARVLVIGITSDTLFPTIMQKQQVANMHQAGNDAVYFEAESPYGHDAFAVDCQSYETPVRTFLTGLWAEFVRS